MFNIKKDIIILSIHNTAISFIHTWPILMIYLASYVYHLNKSNTLNYTYVSVLFFSVGRFVASLIGK